MIRALQIPRNSKAAVMPFRHGQLVRRVHVCCALLIRAGELDLVRSHFERR